MSFTKPTIYNLALSALLLAKEVTDVTTDQSNEVRVLNQHYDIAFKSTLQELDLDSTSQPIPLELIENLASDASALWGYVYKYPSKCVFLRRIESGVLTDTRSTHIAKRIGIYEGQKGIFTNTVSAVGECITDDVPLNSLAPMTGLAIAYNLAFLSAPLIVGKGAARLRDKIQESYLFAKAAAQEHDKRENFVYEADDQRSEFVAARLE